MHTTSLQSCPTLCDPMDCSPPMLFCPWDSPGKNIGVGCHVLLQGIFLTQGSNPHLMSPALAGGFFTCSATWEAQERGNVLVAQSCPTLCNPMDCSLPVSSAHGIFQQEYWSRLPFPTPGDLPNPRDRTHISHISYLGRCILYHCATWEALFSITLPVRDGY